MTPSRKRHAASPAAINTPSMIHPPVLCEYIPSPRPYIANKVRRTGYRIKLKIMLSAVERIRENPETPTAFSRCAFTLSGIEPNRNSKTRDTALTHFGATRADDASTDASTTSKSESSSPGKCFSPTGPGSAPMSFGRCIIASPAAATGAAATTGTGAAGAAGLGAAAGAGLAATDGPLIAASAPSAAGAGAPPSFRKRDGASSGNVVSGCNSRARASNTPSLSRLAGSGMQQSTGHTAAHASWSWKPTHSVHFDGTM